MGLSAGACLVGIGGAAIPDTISPKNRRGKWLPASSISQYHRLRAFAGQVVKLRPHPGYPAIGLPRSPANAAQAG